MAVQMTAGMTMAVRMTQAVMRMVVRMTQEILEAMTVQVEMRVPTPAILVQKPKLKLR